MTLPGGSIRYLKLGDPFDPPWRQAVVLDKSKRNQRIRLAVRVNKQESDQSREFAQFSIGDQIFVVVEGKTDQLRETCQHVCRGLELESGLIQAAAGTALANASEELTFVTASEDAGPEEPRVLPKKEKRTVKDTSSETDSAEDSLDSDGPAGSLKALLSAAEKKLAGSGMASGSGDHIGHMDKRKSDPRFALLKARKQGKSQPSVTDLTQAMLHSGKGFEKSDISALISLEVLKALKSEKKSRGRSQSRSSTEDSSASEKRKEKPRGAARALRAYRKNRTAMKKNPLRHVKRYIRDVEELLGVDAQQPYRLTDFTRRLNWGRLKTLQRCHHMLSEVLQTLLKQDVEQAALQTVLCLRAIHQCALDGGSWETAWKLTYMTDPLQQPRFGGEEADLEVVAAYVRAMDDLEKRSKNQPWKKNQEYQESANRKGGKKGGKGGKGEEEQT